LWAKARSFSAS